MGQCKYCKGEYDYIPGIGVCINCKNMVSSSSSSSYDAEKSRKEAERARAEERAMDWRTYTDRFGNKVRVSGKTGDFQVKMAFWGWMGSSYKGNIEIRYPNGDLYVGGVHGSLFHGKGKMTWKKTGNSYEGDWVYDHQTGKGRFAWADGDYYEGDFVDGKRAGKGKYVWPNGDYYEGDFADGKRTGKGKLVWPNGCYYEGDFVDGKFNGYGVRVYIDGGRYEGQFKDDKRHGKGVLTSPDGTAVEYYYENDKIVCKASEATDEIITRIYSSNTQKASVATSTTANFTETISTYSPVVYKEQKFTDGSRYVGEFVNGKRHGKGTNYFPDGARYDGDWKNGYMNGHGVCVYADGEKYEGEWKDGKRNGQGTHIYKNGAKYVGNWVNDKLQGQGTYFYANGAKYIGEWVNNKKQGKGTYYYVNPTATYDGDWYDNVRHGYGVEEIHAQGGTQRYEGEWKNDKRNGMGKLVRIDGEVAEGYFENGKFVRAAKLKPSADVEKRDVSPEVIKPTEKNEANTPEQSAVKDADREIWDKLIGMSYAEKEAFLSSHPEITVPAGVEKIPQYMFNNCLNLKSIRFNQDLREIGPWAFMGCKNLGTVLVIPSSVEKVCKYAFSTCHSVKKIILPNNIHIEGCGFMCGVTEVEFETEPPKGVVLDRGAFCLCNMSMSKETKKKIKELNPKAFKS